MTEILASTRGAALHLTLNRPEARNALTQALLDDLESRLVAAGDDDSVRVVVLTGAGDRAFCAGADLRNPIFDVPGRENPLVRVMRAMRRCPKPVVGRVNGAALGGGLGLVSACDLVVAADHATFGTPEVRVGVFPMMITTFLIRQLPRRRYFEMTFLGEPLTAAEAVACDLVNWAVPAAELDARVDAVVGKLVANSPTALRAGKKALEVMQDLDVEATYEYASRAIAELAVSEDAREGRAAFVEKRAPRWTGR